MIDSLCHLTRLPATYGLMVKQSDKFYCSQTSVRFTHKEARAMVRGGTPCSHVNHSSGVAGADLAWQQLGKRYGVSTRAYRPFDSPAPDNPCSVVLDQCQLLQADPLVRQAATVLEVDLEGLPLQQQNYIRKNYFQVELAEAVFAVARILRGKQSGRAFDTLAGGTSWAYHMAILSRKAIFVFDDEEGCCDCTQQWFLYDYSGACLLPYPGTPTLPMSFAGIGTRELSPAGRRAIAEVYHETFRQEPE